MFGRKTMVICGALAVILAASYGAVRSWSSTAHGMLDWRVGVLLKYAELTKVDLFQEGRPVADIREFSRRGTGILKAAPTPLPVVRDIDFPGPAGRIPARVYVPGDQASYPVIIYYHGGG